MRSETVTRLRTRCARLITAATLAGALVVGLANPALASPPATATGTWTLEPPGTTTLIRTAAGNIFYSVSGEMPDYSGGLTGKAVANYLLVVHANGSFEGQGTETCSPCTLGGRTGGYVAVFSFQGTPDGSFTGQFAFQSGSGGLAGLHGGGGTIQGNSNSISGTYDYEYLFAP